MRAASTRRNRLLRLACDRCHSQKLRCPRPSEPDNENGDPACHRCRRAGKTCAYSKKGKSGRPSKVIIDGAHLRSSFLAQPAETLTPSSRGSLPPEPEVINADGGGLGPVPSEAKPEALLEACGSVSNTEDTRTLSVSDFALTFCTLGQEATPALPNLSDSTSSSNDTDHPPLCMQANPSQLLSGALPDLGVDFDFEPGHFSAGTQSIDASQISKSPAGLGSETWNDFLLSNHTSVTSEISSLGGQIPPHFDDQGSIFSNPSSSASDLTSSRHYSYLGSDYPMSSHPSGDIVEELLGLNHRINCALVSYRSIAAIGNFGHLQMDQAARDITDIARKMLVMTKQCLPYIPNTPDSSPISSPASSMDVPHEGTAQGSISIYNEHQNWSRVVFPFLACYSLALDYYELVLNGLCSVPATSFQSSLDIFLVPHVIDFFFNQVRDAFAGSQTTLLDPLHREGDNTNEKAGWGGNDEPPSNGRIQNAFFLDTALDEIRGRSSHIWDRTRKLGITTKKA